MKLLNLGCGDIYIPDQSWINVDYEASPPWVYAHNLLRPLPFSSSCFDLVYTSHFLEHIPKDKVLIFLCECYRVLRPGGILRVTLPDAAEMFQQFLYFRHSDQHDKADFLMLEIIDQCVRSRPGGLLEKFYLKLTNLPSGEQYSWKEFIFERTGHRIPDPDSHLPARKGKSAYQLKSLFSASARLRSEVQARFKSFRRRIATSLVDEGFRGQNISLATVGEKHHWLWDFVSLSDEIYKAGFLEPSKLSCSTSAFVDFPFYPLDLTKDGHPRKGLETMYVEARRPLL